MPATAALATVSPPHPLLALVAQDLAQVAGVLQARLVGPVEPLPRGVDHLVNGGGKRLRPALACLVHRLFGGDHPHLPQVAAVAEYIHAATLAHDDVIDNADLRRSRDTLRRVVGNHRAILVGDYLFAEAYLRLAQLNQHDLAQALARTIRELVQGEVMQLERAGDLSFDVADYEALAGLKTGSLFGWAALAGAALAGQPAPVQQEAQCFARAVGVAFQIADDLLDFSPSSGKDPHLDLLEGKMTLPVIFALEQQPALAHPLTVLQDPHTPPQEAAHALARLKQVVESPQVRDLCLGRAHHHLAQARRLLATWPQGQHAHALSQFLDSLVERNH